MDDSSTNIVKRLHELDSLKQLACPTCKGGFVVYGDSIDKQAQLIQPRDNDKASRNGENVIRLRHKQ